MLLTFDIETIQIKVNRRENRKMAKKCSNSLIHLKSRKEKNEELSLNFKNSLLKRLMGKTST